MSTTAARKSGAESKRGWIAQPLHTLREEVDSLLSQTLGEAEGWLSPRTYIPSLDVQETDDAIVVDIDLPGVVAGDVDVHVNGQVLNVRGERKLPVDEGRTIHRLERRRGTFSRTITLACPVQEEKVAATYRDGVLTVTLPKTAEARGRRVPVSAV